MLSITHAPSIFVTMLALSGFFAAATAQAGDDVPLNTKRGVIDIPAENRSVLKELSPIAAKYPKLFSKARIFENMCEEQGTCFYVPHWTACCCPSAGETICEAFPHQ